MLEQNLNELTDFGRRLATLRKQVGYTQIELAAALGVTQRMISYYEGQPEYPPAAQLPKLARLLNFSTDELLGIEYLKKTRQPNTRLQRRFQRVEKLPTKEKRQLLQVIDTFSKAAQLPESVSNR